MIWLESLRNMVSKDLELLIYSLGSDNLKLGAPNDCCWTFVHDGTSPSKFIHSVHHNDHNDFELDLLLIQKNYAIEWDFCSRGCLKADNRPFFIKGVFLGRPRYVVTYEGESIVPKVCTGNECCCITE